MIGVPGMMIALLAVAAAYFLSSPSPLQPVQPGDTIVVTGASSGIGKHAALTLAKEGYTIFATVRKEQDGEALINSAEHHGVDVDLIKILLLDITNTEDVARGVEIVSSFVGERGLKGLFNNAGTGGDSGSTTLSSSVEFGDIGVHRRVMEVNYFGTVQVTKAFLSLLRKGKGRVVVNLSLIHI